MCALQTEQKRRAFQGLEDFFILRYNLISVTLRA